MPDEWRYCQNSVKVIVARAAVHFTRLSNTSPNQSGVFLQIHTKNKNAWSLYLHGKSIDQTIDSRATVKQSENTRENHSRWNHNHAALPRSSSGNYRSRLLSRTSSASAMYAFNNAALKKEKCDYLSDMDEKTVKGEVVTPSHTLECWGYRHEKLAHDPEWLLRHVGPVSISTATP